MPIVNRSISASQNVGAGFGGCWTDPVLWNTVRRNKTGAVDFRVLDIENGLTWDTARFTMWLYSASGNPFKGPISVTKTWGVDSPWGKFGGVPGGDFRLRTQITHIIKNGFPQQCRPGSWSGTLRFLT